MNIIRDVLNYVDGVEGELWHANSCAELGRSNYEMLNGNLDILTDQLTHCLRDVLEEELVYCESP